MTTTSSTTTTAPSTSSVVSGATQSLLTSLGSGSGVDTSALVSSLVTAQFANQSAALTAKADKLTAQISSVSTVKNAIGSFATALGALVKGGTLTTQPVSTNTGVVSASALPGAKLAGLSSSITVGQLAAAQVAVSRSPVADRAASLGTGTLTLTLGTASVDASGAMTGFTAGSAGPVTIDIASGSDSLDGIAAAINAKGAGVSASVVTDANGSAFLSLKGATGGSQAFTLQATTDNGNLSQLNVGVGATGTRLSSAAQNAKLTVDGVAVERASNTVADLVAGAKLQLTGTGSVALTSTTPTDALSNAVTDFVDAYNEVLTTLKTATDPINGVLRSDTAATALLAQLKGITLTGLVPGSAAGAPTTLAAIGVATGRDGTLSVNGATLSRALADTPRAVEAMFAWSPDASSGLSAVLSSLSLRAGSTTYGLGASTGTYAGQQTAISARQSKLDDQKAATTTRLTNQFAGMNSRVTAYKSVQSFLTNQIAAWNKSGS